MTLPQAARDVLDHAVAGGVGSGAALAWCCDGELTVHVTGHTALAHWPHAPVTEKTRFDLASLTKPIATTTLLAQDLAAGRLRIDDRLDAHLGVAAGTVRGQATIGELMSHTSGAPAWLDYFAATLHIDPEQRKQAVQSLVLNTDNTNPPGSRAVYSDLGYMSLGWLLESLHGAPLDQLFATRIAAPLGLRAHYRRLGVPQNDRGDVVATEVWPPRCGDGLPLRGQVHDDNCAALDGVAGHAGLFGSIADVASWAQEWLAAVQGRDNRLGLSSDVCRMLTTTPGCNATTWRHGWDTPTRPGSSAGELVPEGTFGHLGFTGTSVWISPEVSAFAVLLTNRVHPTREANEGIRALRPRLHDIMWEGVHKRRLR